MNNSYFSETHVGPERRKQSGTRTCISLGLEVPTARLGRGSGPDLKEVFARGIVGIPLYGKLHNVFHPKRKFQSGGVLDQGCFAVIRTIGVNLQRPQRGISGFPKKGVAGSW